MPKLRANRERDRSGRIHVGGVALCFAICLTGAVAVAHADLGPPREIVRQTLDDMKKGAHDAPHAAVEEAEDTKKHAKSAVEDALDAGFSIDASTDAGKADAGKADAGDAGDVPVSDAERDLDRSRADRAARSRRQLELELVKLGSKPMDESLRSELRLHAKHLAWLDRIGSLADRAKDSDSLAQVRRLLEEESKRHDGWLSAWSSDGGR